MKRLTNTCKAAIAAALLLIAAQLPAQVVQGIIRDHYGQPIDFARLVWDGYPSGCLTDSTGHFSTTRPDSGHLHLIITAVGFHNDTIHSEGPETYDITLRQLSNGLTVEITDEKKGTHIGLQPHKTEVITQTELQKDACCDLAGCFNTQASVEARTTNVVTNAKELQVLGLAGVYNQLLIDGLPLFRGLSYTYGISGVPGPTVQTIFVAKGAGSVLQGPEGVSGQINVIPLDPRKADPLYANIYGNSFGETQYNLHGALKGKKAAAFIALHSAQPGYWMDQDEDEIRDMPKLSRYHLMASGTFSDDDSTGFHGSATLRLLQENRRGGQNNRHPIPYIQRIHYNQAEGWLKLGYRQNPKNRTGLNIGLQQHRQSSDFGFTQYLGTQTYAVATLEHSTVWRDGHQLKAGLSYRHLDLIENIFFWYPTPPKSYDGIYYTKEMVPGIYAENTSFLWKERITLIAGARLDHHNQFGPFFSPRALIRLTPGSGWALRLSAGRAWRTPLPFAENMQMLGSGRDIIFEEALQPERATNFGLNLDKTFYLAKAETRASIDAYHTRFQNQFFPDYDRDPSHAYLSNFTGKSMGYGIQAENYWEAFDCFSIRAAYNYLDVFRVENGIQRSLPYISRHKLMAAASLWTPERRQHLDFNIHWYGPQRLPDSEGSGLDLPTHSDPYMILNAQVATVIGKKGILDIYLGCENILGFRQYRQIASWQDPFSSTFDPSFVWAPMRGREFYAGLRIRPFAK